MRRRWSVPALVAASALTAACDPSRSGQSPHAPNAATGVATPSRLELLDRDDRPRLGLVAREGDPLAGMAMAVAHDLGSEASVALAYLIETRLAAAGFTVDTRPSELGYQVRALVSGPGDAARFVGAATQAALDTTSIEPAHLHGAAERLQALTTRRWLGPADAAAARCSGELGIAPGAPVLDPRAPAGRQQLETWRRAAHNVRSVAFAALGPRGVLDAAASAVSRAATWPAGAPPEDAWPQADFAGAARVPGEAARTTVAVRAADAAAALLAAHTLGAPGSDLAVLTGALDPAWTIERVVATTRVRGACVRVDLAADPRVPPTDQHAALAAVVLLQEATTALRAAGAADWTLEDGVLRATDPRDAVGAAAWRALSGRAEPGPPRFVASHVRDSESTRFEGELRTARSNLGRRVVEPRIRTETGQGELWAMVASPCGTHGEGLDDAGLGALAARAAALSSTSDVTVEPWSSPAGIGLIAHAPRLGPSETPGAHAERVGNALGRAAVGQPLATAFATARGDAIALLGSAPDPGRVQVLTTLTADHPAWLDARGTFAALGAASREGAHRRLRSLWGGPVRLAVLANWDAGQGEVVTATVERWLRPFGGGETCAPAPTLTAAAGDILVEAAVEAPARARALVAATLPPGTWNEGAATAWLLNRPGGWLERALDHGKFTAGARAELLGSPAAAALFVQVDAFGDDLGGAVAQIRGLLDRLARGAVTVEDASAASQALGRAAARSRLDPRTRLVELWAGTPPAATIDAASLRRMHARALPPGRHLVVRVLPRS